MSDEIVPALVWTNARAIEVVQQPLAEPPAPAAGGPNAEQIHLLDAAFVSDPSRQDAMVGLVGLSLTAPWIGDLIADHFRTPPDEDEADASKKRR